MTSLQRTIKEISVQGLCQSSPPRCGVNGDAINIDELSIAGFEPSVIDAVIGNGLIKRDQERIEITDAARIKRMPS